MKKWDRCADLVEYGILRQEWRDEVTTKMTACRHAPEGGQLSWPFSALLGRYIAQAMRRPRALKPAQDSWPQMHRLFLNRP
ncbi:MAG: hypothetical protein A3K19_18355 [Lentisphaerae bacterium RIFOXYB12_FULL_65_16]|nr:MAG: hypothetical protein A3K18_13930 [Lentisphaerae bacterium RIFOXYA12_64_32]OGV92925.1 MAG: hypothetical protein A3K19_18355 [Lentisphaerae bacterium RIFOXYB12_FULL_65_16]